MNIGEQIRLAAKKKGINHSWIADKINMNEKTFSGKLRRDSFTAEELLQVANVLSLDLNELKNKLAEEENVKMIVKILLHNIEISWRDGNTKRGLFESDEEHIEDCIRDEYVEGELCQFDHEEGKEVYGWWKIIN